MFRESVYNGIYGLCIGDAIGVPAEFKSREELRVNPITGMTGFGTHYQKPGTWSDDTSLALCLLDSLSNGLDYLDIMDKFRSWEELGMYTPYGRIFDVGMATDEAIDNYIHDVPILQCGGTTEYNNGNGSLMRILPLAMFIKAQKITFGQAMEITSDVSSLTHGHLRSKMACCIYVTIALQLLEGKPLKQSIKDGLAQAQDYCKDKSEYAHFHRIFSQDFKTLKENEINSSGYVIDTLEASLWCLLNTSNYHDCILKAVNLGDDTDTTASVSGGLAGLAYGMEGIDKDWREGIARPDLINEICERFIKANS
ncbi:MAG: ADP-ribosylglycohydrolase family protein [Sphaerochaetaceae bacterium]